MRLFINVVHRIVSGTSIILSDGAASPLIRPTSKGRLVKPKAPPNKVMGSRPKLCC